MSETDHSASLGALARHDAQLADLGTQAESCVADDPATCLVVLRQFAERLTEIVCARAGLDWKDQESQFLRLRRLREQEVLTPEQCDSFEYLRRLRDPRSIATAMERAKALADAFAPPADGTSATADHHKDTADNTASVTVGHDEPTPADGLAATADHHEQASGEAVPTIREHHQPPSAHTPVGPAHATTGHQLRAAVDAHPAPIDATATATGAHQQTANATGGRHEHTADNPACTIPEHVQPTPANATVATVDATPGHQLQTAGKADAAADATAASAGHDQRTAGDAAQPTLGHHQPTPADTAPTTTHQEHPNGAPCPRLHDRAAQFLLSHTPTLILATTREAADDAVRHCCSTPGTAIGGVYRHTVRDLVLALSEAPMLERGLQPVRRIAREAIAADIAARNRSRLTYLAPVASFPGFPRALARTLEDLRLNRITAAQLHSAGRSGADLALLLEAYEEALANGRFADHAARCVLALDNIPARALLLLDIDVRTVVERQLIDAVKQAAPHTLELRATPGTGSTRLHSLQRYVLSGESAPPLPPDDTVAIFSASGEALECVEIARRILRLAAEGTRFDSIAILLRSAERHQPLVQEALRRAGIPAWYSRGARRPDVSGRAFLALLHCALEDLSAERFAEYLSLGQMPAEDGEERQSSRWERLLSKAAVISGLDRWERRLDGLANDLLKALEQQPDSEEQRERLTKELAALEALRGFALPLLHEMAGFPAAANWRTWLDLLGDLARRAIDKPARIHELLEELEPMAPVGPVSLAEVLATLGPELATLRREEERPRYGRVFVGSLADARGMSFDAVFVPGLNEGVFPKPVREDPLLLDAQRATLGIEGSRDDKHLLQAAVAAASKRLVCSWSRIDLATGRERVPSFYAFEVADAAGYGEIDVARFIREARDRTEARLGWPAPADPADAIDSAEYDLATLRPQWDNPQPGAAAWLKVVNPHVWRALDARRLRWSTRWTRADGLTDADVHVGIALEQRHALSVRAYAPTRLEQFARCPYRFYLQSVLGLKPADRPAALQRIDPGIRGELYHDVQARFYTELAEAGLLPVTATTLDDALRRLEAVLATVEAEFAERHKPAIPVVWNTDIERIRGDLRGWLRHVALNENDWTPLHFEYEIKNVEIAEGRLLQGRIDLIEQHTSGVLRVTDHKTGKPPEDNRIPQRVGGGEFLQPALYAMAAQTALERPVREARLFYATLRGNYTAFPIRPSAETQEAVAAILDTIDHALRNGELPAAPRADGCKWCDYLPVCGPYEEQRTSLKPRIPALVEIREQR